MKVPFIILLLVFIAKVDKGDANLQKEITVCEPYGLNKTEKYFVRKLNLKLYPGNFISTTVHHSKQSFPGAPLGIIDVLNGLTVPLAYQQYIDLKKVNHFEPVRHTNYTMMFNFYYGDSAVCRMFDPISGHYKTIEIGFHTAKFYCVVSSGTYFTVNFEKHIHEAFAIIGVTIIRGVSDIGNWYTLTREEVLKKFPQHEVVIDEIYSRATNEIKY